MKAYILIKHYEGLSKVSSNGMVYPYVDATGHPTIGYGNRFYKDGQPVREDDPPITKIAAEKLLAHYVVKFRHQVKAIVPDDLNDNQIDALTSFAYNVGVSALESSTLLKKIKAKNSTREIVQEFLRWDKAGGKVLPGLLKRRNSEAHLYQFGTFDFQV